MAVGRVLRCRDAYHVLVGFGKTGFETTHLLSSQREISGR